MGKYRAYTDEDIIRLSAEVTSMSQLLSALGLRVAGGNYANMKRNLSRLELECTHWKGQAWNTGERLKDWSKYKKAANCKKHLIKERGHVCEKCGLSEWEGGPIPLEIHHLDCNRVNNELNNLIIYCPNCHSQAHSTIKNS